MHELLPATSGYLDLVGGAIRAIRGLECEPQVTEYNLSMHVNACASHRDRARRFGRSILLELGVFFVFFENVQVFCAAPSCPVAAVHIFLTFIGSGLKYGSYCISIQPTPGMARYQPRTMLFGGSESPQLFSAASG
jgi:hypothetical protein